MDTMRKKEREKHCSHNNFKNEEPKSKPKQRSESLLQ